MHSRPTDQELLDAVRYHLTERVLPALSDPQLRFQTLVAAHVLGVVERELAMGEQPLWHEWEALGTLLDEEEAPRPASLAELRLECRDRNLRLAEQIRSGARDDDPALLPFLQQQVTVKLLVSNPKFRRDRSPSRPLIPCLTAGEPPPPCSLGHPRLPHTSAKASCAARRPTAGARWCRLGSSRARTFLWRLAHSGAGGISLQSFKRESPLL